MKNRTVTIALILVALCGVGAFGADDLSKPVASALARAGDNAVELRKALNDAEKDWRKKPILYN